MNFLISVFIILLILVGCFAFITVVGPPLIVIALFIMKVIDDFIKAICKLIKERRNK